MRAIHAESVDSYERLLQRNPDDQEAFMHMIWARKYACDWQGFGEKMEKMIHIISSLVSH